MKACVALRWSSARIGQRRSRQTPWKQINRCSSTERRRNNASPIVPESTPSDESLNVNPNNKTITTAVGDLPLSPIMDPSYWEATMRHQAPKAKEGKPQNSVERQFRKNPFAKALATPIRQCTASRVRLPTFFLQDFNLIAHPETGQPWWVPRSLVWEESAESQQADTLNTEFSMDYQEFRDEQANVETDRGGSDNQGEVSRVDTPTAVQSDHAKPYGPAAYVLARQDLISSFTKKASGYENHTRRLFGGSSSRYAKFAGRAIWREDMDTFILGRMRQEIVSDLLYLSRLCTEDSRHYIVKCYGWDDVQYKHKGAVLWFGDTGQSDATDNPEAQPGPFATYDVSNGSATTTVAVHNIPMLLGAEDTAKVRQNAVALGDGSLFMLAGRRTTNLQLKLWRLQGYLADYREPIRLQI
ncbi:hypothetical protein HD806DRAFT_533698 [Xylariaceae sp. AK1471]|nr:hypothetical protein HD806DRAFT_533698 [Xylariaceae sp. AK1471]